MTNSINEILKNKVIFVIGSNTTEAHPIIGNKIKQAVKNGSKLIVIDPRKTELSFFSNYYLQIKPGTDIVLINGIMNIIINNNWHKKKYIKERCIGYESLKESIKKYTPDIVEKITGINKKLLYKISKIYANTKRAGIYYTLGITEHIKGTSNVINLANMAMLTGHVGVKYAGINPLRGQNNVQGACDMGCLPNYYPGYKKIDNEDDRKFFEKFWNVKLNPNIGLKTPEMIDSAIDNNLKLMYIMGEDPVLTDSDSNNVKKALNNLEFLIVQDLFLTETAKYANVFLPANNYSEKDGTFTNTERRVQRVRKAVSSPDLCKNDWEIICDIARTFIKNDNRKEDSFKFKKSEEIFEEIRSCIKNYKGITYKRINKNGLQWPCTDIKHKGTLYLHKNKFNNQKGIMIPVEYKRSAEIVDKKYPFLLNTGRMLYHYNVSTENSKTLRKIYPFERAQINPIDAKKYNLNKNSIISISSRRGIIRSNIQITDIVPKGMIFMTIHYKGSPVNELTNSKYDPITKTAEFKITAVNIKKEI